MDTNHAGPHRRRRARHVLSVQRLFALLAVPSQQRLVCSSNGFQMWMCRVGWSNKYTACVVECRSQSWCQLWEIRTAHQGEKKELVSPIAVRLKKLMSQGVAKDMDLTVQFDERSREWEQSYYQMHEAGTCVSERTFWPFPCYASCLKYQPTVNPKCYHLQPLRNQVSSVTDKTTSVSIGDLTVLVKTH